MTLLPATIPFGSLAVIVSTSVERKGTTSWPLNLAAYSLDALRAHLERVREAIYDKERQW